MRTRASHHLWPALLLLVLLRPMPLVAQPTISPAQASADSQVAKPALTEGEAGFCRRAGRSFPVIRLWPAGKAPDEPRPQKPEYVLTEGRGGTPTFTIVSVTEPSMIVLPAPPEKNTGVALLIAPGGGYGCLGADLVQELADWFNPRGITCVLLKYRVPKRHMGYDMHFQPLQDAQRAMGILRSRAAQWGIDPHKIGIAGASAGGNLAACLLMNHAKRWYQPLDDFDRTSCRPDFGVLLYPAYLTDPILSRQRVGKLGFDQIRAGDTPPTLITIAYPDKFTFGSTEFYLALQSAHVPAELHVYGEGGHGGGIARYPFGQWAQECLRFLAQQKLLPASPSNREIVGGEARAETVTLEDSSATLRMLHPGGEPSGRAVIVCADGRTSDGEATAARFATWLTSIGVTAAILSTGNRPDGSLEIDLAAAMKLMRGRAEAWRFDPRRIGVCGIGSTAKTALLAGATAVKTGGGVNPAFVILLSPQGLGEPGQPTRFDPRLTAVRRPSPPVFVALAGADAGLHDLADYYLTVQPTRVLAECHVYDGPELLRNGQEAPPWNHALARWIKDLDAKPVPDAKP